MIVVTNSITMVTELNAGSLVKLLLLPYAQDFFSHIRSKRNLTHFGNNNSLTREPAFRSVTIVLSLVTTIIASQLILVSQHTIVACKILFQF